MKAHALYILFLSAGLTVTAETNTPHPRPKNLTPAPAHAPAGSSSISIQEMLESGPPQIKLHSLIMITQGKFENSIDESYLPAFKVCAEDSSTPIRSITAQLLGQHFIEGQEYPSPDAVQLLVKLGGDDISDVRYNAAYYGLSQVQNKSSDIIELLINIGSSHREPELYDRIVQSLKGNREQVSQILDRKLKEDNDIAAFEIYEDFTGRQPPQSDQYLNMPCSRPKIFIFKEAGGDALAYKAELEAELKSIGIKDPELYLSGIGDNLLLKTYITKDRIAVEKAFAMNETFSITQELWLTPQLEMQINAMRKRNQD